MIATRNMSIGQTQTDKSGLVLWTKEAAQVVPTLPPALTLVHRTSNDIACPMDIEAPILTPMSIGHKPRTNIHVKLSGLYQDVDDVLAGWAAHRKKSANIIAAIRLYEAVLQGDIDQIGQLLTPEQSHVLEAAFAKNAPSPVLESKESKKRSRTEYRGEVLAPEVEAIIDELVILCAKDRALNQADLVTYATRLHTAGYTDAQVKRWGAECWPQDWRAAKGERPSFKAVIDNIAAVKLLPAAGESPYLQDAYFQDRDDDPGTANPFARDDGLPPRQIDLLPPGHPQLQWWDALKGDLSVRIGKATFDTWIRPIAAIGFADADTLVLEVSGMYLRDWFVKQIEPFCVDAYNRMDRRGEGKDKPSIKFSVVVKGDDQYRGKG